MTERKPKRRKRTVAVDLLRIAIVVALFGAVAWALSLPYVKDEVLNIEHLRTHLRDSRHGEWIFFVASAIVTSIGVPRLWVCVASGTIFGAVLGAIIAQFATMLGAVLNFYYARLLLRGPMRRNMPRKVQFWYDRFGENGFRWLLYMRLFPLSNATFTNSVGGISPMRLRDFLAATFLGYLPLTIVFALFGSSAAKRSWPQMVIAAVILVAVLAGRTIHERRRAAQGLAPEVPEDLDENTADNAAVEKTGPAAP